MTLDRKKVALIVSTVFAIVLGVLYLYVFEQREQTQHIDEMPKPGRFANPSIKFIAVLFRHGDRAPYFKYKTDPYADAFPEGVGELTKIGKQHMYKKGQLFRRLYNGFINDMYLDSEIVIKTTNKSRTFMSAAMVLAGMYPPKDYQKWLDDLETVWQPIPIYFDTPDHSMLFGQKGVCPVYESVINDVISRFTYGNEETKTEQLLSFLSEKCGESIDIHKLPYLHDLFVCQKSAGLQLPVWGTPHLMETIKSIAMNGEDLKTIFENKTLHSLSIGPLLKEISLNMESRSNNSTYDTTRKMHLYSGHDLSIAMTMGYLGYNITELCDFGASIHFHLYFDEKLGYTVKLFYFNRWDDEKGEEVSIPICGSPCKLQDFIKLTKDSFSFDWEKTCKG